MSHKTTTPRVIDQRQTTFLTPRGAIISGRTKPLTERFWTRVNKTDTCWLWTGCKDRNGYGLIGKGGRNGGCFFAHRLSWELHNGPIPDNLYVCHHCDIPLCCRPDHLFLGSQLDNIRDCSRKGRMHTGEANGGSKLTENQVREIRARYASGERIYAIAGAFGVNQSCISMIVHRKSWKHI